jgi:hypothetical protein
MSNLYRGPSIDPFLGSFGQAVSKEKIFRNRPIRKKNCFWRPCLFMDQVSTSALLIEDRPEMLPTKFRFIWPSGFRGEQFKKISKSETRVACGGHVC